MPRVRCPGMNPVKAALLWASQSPSLGTRLPRMRFVRRSVARFMPGESAEEALAAAERMAEEAGVTAAFTRLGENTADLALAAVIAVDVWKTTPFMALLLLAALQMLPRELYEAARIDGAS